MDVSKNTILPLAPIVGRYKEHASHGADHKAIMRTLVRDTPYFIKETAAFAHHFKGATEKETARNIYNFLHNQVEYTPDTRFHQQSRGPAVLLRKGGDCKSFSGFTSGVLWNLGIPNDYIFIVESRDAPSSGHVYVQTRSGLIIDAVPGTTFNVEGPYWKKQKYMTKLSSIGGRNNYATVNGINTFTALITLFLKAPPVKNETLRNAARYLFKNSSKALRYLILLAFRLNWRHIATAYYYADKRTQEKLQMMFYNIGGSPTNIRHAVMLGYRTPAAASWDTVKLAYNNGKYGRTYEIAGTIGNPAAAVAAAAAAMGTAAASAAAGTAATAATGTAAAGVGAKVILSIVSVLGPAFSFLKDNGILDKIFKKNETPPPPRASQGGGNNNILPIAAALLLLNN